MRISRFAFVIPVVLVWAGCASNDPSELKSGSSVFVAQDEPSESLASELALVHVADRPDLVRGVGDVEVRRVLIDQRGEAHARLRQTIDGIPVFEGEAIVHIGTDGLFNSMTDKFVRDIHVDTTPALQAQEAVDLAAADMGGKRMLLSTPKVDMQILRHNGSDYLTYRVQLEMRTVDDEPTMPVVFIDAHNGNLVWSYDNLETAKDRKTYTAKNRNQTPGTLVLNEGDGPDSDAVVNEAHDNAGFVYDYYSSAHGRDSFDDAGATIISSVHYSRNYVNAYWNGVQMVYGDGDGSQSGPLTVLDVVGHEITHAVTERTSNLTYANESGALNEAMSDIFGASIERYRDGAISGNTWKLAEDCWTPGTPGDALRYMNDPALAGDYDYWPTRYTGTSDNGGVHWNSGIANLAFYLMVAGGTHPRGKTSNNVPALSSNSNTSIQMASAIFYWANTQCLTAGSNFTHARECTQDAASALYGSNAKNSVEQAWIAVGVPAPLTWTEIYSEGGLAAGKNGKINYSHAKPAGATAMKFELAGDDPDADLYVRFGSPPTTASYDCRSVSASSNETCTLTNAQSGTYYVMINAYSAYAGATYTASSGQ